MNDEELQKTIDEINKAMNKIGPLDIYDNTSSRSGKIHCQGVLNKAYDILFDLRKHLLYIQKKGAEDEKI